MATSTTTVGALVCPNGHGPGVSGSRFCTYCGTVLVAAQAPGPVAGPTAPAGVTAATVPVAAQPGMMPGMPPMQPGTPPPVPGGWQQVPQAPVQTIPQAQWQQVSTAAGQAYPPPPVAGQPYPPYPPAPMPAPGAAPGQQVKICGTCRNMGAGLAETVLICPECAWLRPLLPGYALDKSVFLWAQDGQAMQALQSVPAIHKVVATVSDKVGRPWIESTFNAIRLGPRQLPDIWNNAVLAARILGLPSMPDVYISGDQMWNTYTFGTENSSFIVLGTSHLINFSQDELLFVLAREMGHCRAGHALWKTVLRFVAGDTSVHGGLLSDGVINAINPTKFIQGVIDIPLMAWSRQSDITADRAGLLAVGDEALARRVLLAWAVRSARLLQMVNIEEWMKQEDASGDAMTRVSEATTTSQMYTTRRLKLLRQAASEPGLMRWSASIQPIRKKLMPVPTQQMTGLGVGTVKAAKPAVAPRLAAPPRPAGAPGAAGQAPGNRQQGTGNATAPAVTADSIRVICNKCQAAMRVPMAILRGKPFVNVRCPSCKNVLTLRPKGPAPAGAPAGPGAAGASKPAAPASAAAGSKPNGATAAAPAAKPLAAPAMAGGKGTMPVVPPSPAGAGKKPPPAPSGAKR